MLPPGNDEERLDSLFRAYRDACPDPDPSPNFMPQLWLKIEARQRSTFWFGRLARGFVTAAVAASLVMGALLLYPAGGPAQNTASYVEMLANGNVPEGPEFYEPVRLDSPSPDHQPVNINLDEL